MLIEISIGSDALPIVQQALRHAKECPDHRVYLRFDTDEMAVLAAPPSEDDLTDPTERRNAAIRWDCPDGPA